jgi:hypothetical protein
MSHFAEIDDQGTVLRVIVAEQSFIDSGAVGDPARWVQTSYNTSGGMHRLGGTPLRMNYAGIGYTYDRDRDAFIPPKPFASWILDESSCLWTAPVPRPEDGQIYIWDEEAGNWQLSENQPTYDQGTSP